MVLGMGMIGWLLAFAIGFVIGAIFFMSIKAQVDYVMKDTGPAWLTPVALYLRLAFVAAVLFLVAKTVPREKMAASLLAATVGIIVARVMIGRFVRSGGPDTPAGAEDEGAA
jgi:F1F0 ATPase subunit 2